MILGSHVVGSDLMAWAEAKLMAWADAEHGDHVGGADGDVEWRGPDEGDGVLE